MTSPRAQTTRLPAEPEEKPKTGLSPTQVVAGAAGSVTATVAASTLGVAGTFIGAGLASVVSTVAAATYTHSLERGTRRLTRVLPVQLPGRVVPVQQSGRDETQVMAALPPVTGSTTVSPPSGQRGGSRLSRKRWIRLGVYAAGMFVLVMGVITGIEIVGQKPVSALVGGSTTSGSTTIGELTNTSSSSDLQRRSPTTPSSPASAPATEGSAPTVTKEESTTTDPSEESTSETTAPATSSQSSVRSSAPKSTADPDAGTSAAPTKDGSGSSSITQQAPEQGGSSPQSP